MKKSIKVVTIVLAVVFVFAFASTAFAALAMDSFAITRKGDVNGYVRACQTIIKYNYSDLDNDGNFGSTTESKVKSYQGSKNLTNDGVVGQKTWASLQKHLVYSRVSGGMTYLKIKLANGTTSNSEFFRYSDLASTWDVYKAATGSAAGIWHNIIK